MKQMPFFVLLAALVSVCTLSTAHAQTQASSAGDVRAGKDRIGADYRSAKAACERLSGNPKDICREEAKGREKVALAELEYSRSATVENRIKIDLAKADAAYEVAKERCDDRAGNERDVCMKEAKAAEVRAKADARARNASKESRSDAASEQRDADYKVAAERCDTLAGDAKRNCMDAAKTRHGKD